MFSAPLLYSGASTNIFTIFKAKKITLSFDYVRICGGIVYRRMPKLALSARVREVEQLRDDSIVNRFNGRKITLYLQSIDINGDNNGTKCYPNRCRCKFM